MSFDDLVSDLRQIVGADYVLTRQEDLAVYECDAETLDVARPDVVVLPDSIDQVSRIAALANRHEIPVCPRGAGTGLSGGSTAVTGGISLALTRMTRVLDLDPFERIARVEVGATNLSVSQAAARYGLYFAPDPSSQSASTIGGNVAENAGGPHCLKYGMTTNSILAVRVVLADGEIVDLGSLAATTTDLDLRGLFVGSEGTLGIACQAWLKLTPRAPAVETFLAYFPSVLDCGRAVSNIIAKGVIPAAMEMIDKITLNAVEDYLAMGLNRGAEALLIVELDGSPASIDIEARLVRQSMEDNQVLSIERAQDDEHRARIWRARKTSFGALGRIAPNGYVLDGVIPRSRLAESIEKIAAVAEKHSLTIANVYHAGDGNLHPCLLYHKENEDEVRRVMAAGKEILKLCVEMGGTLSGEHGIGIEKLEEMPLVFDEVDLEAMRIVKDAFDPVGILNPSKAVPMPRICGESGRRPLLRHRLLTGC